MKGKDKQSKGRGSKPLTRGKKAIFMVITLSIPLLFLLMLELLLRAGNYGGNMSLFIFPDRFDGQYGMLNHHYHEKFFFRTSTFTAGRGDVFLRDKPENGFRVFVLGASTTESFPYGYNGMFSLVLRDMLEDVLPDRHVEVVNLGITATNTYTLYDQTREILKQQPDVIMIYTGQNEYYGALGVASAEMIGRNPAFVRTYLILFRYRTFLMLRDAMGWVINRVTGFNKDEAPGTLMQRMAQQNAIPLDSDLYHAGKRQFSGNLDAILNIYSKHKVPVFLSSLASNLKDHPPFFPVVTKGHPMADDVFEQAHNYYAELDFETAFQLFRQARDLDGLRFRAPSSFNSIIEDKVEREGVWHIPTKEVMREYAENGIIGSDLMLEHLHPNSVGYFLMGKTFFDALAASGLPGFNPDLSLLKEPDVYRDAMFLSELDHRMVWHRVQALMNSWPFVDEPDPNGYPTYFSPQTELDRLAMNHVQGHISWEEAKTSMARWYSQNGQHHEAIFEIQGALRVVPYEEEAWRFAGWLAQQGGKLDEAFHFYSQAYRIQPTNTAARNLGMILVDQEQFTDAGSWLEQAFRLDRRDYSSLFNASVAYASADDFERAQKVAEQLNRLNPNYTGLQMWRRHLITRVN